MTLNHRNFIFTAIITLYFLQGIRPEDINSTSYRLISRYDNERLKRSAGTCKNYLKILTINLLKDLYSLELLKYFLVFLSDSPFDASVTGISTTKVEAKIGSEIWSDRGYSISSISDGLLGATLFQTNHYVNARTMSIDSNRDAEIFVAVYEEGNREGGLMEALQADGWTLKNEWYLEWSNQHKLNKVWSKNINAGETISFTSTKDRMTFAMLIKEGKVFVWLKLSTQLIIKIIVISELYKKYF